MAKLLIVEDEYIIAQDIANIVTDLDYQVIGRAKSAQETLEILETKTPDLILLDVRIKGKMNGIELAAIIEERFNIPYIFVTSFLDIQIKKNVNTGNSMGFVLKPFEKSQIKDTLASAFSLMAS